MDFEIWRWTGLAPRKYGFGDTWYLVYKGKIYVWHSSWCSAYQGLKFKEDGTNFSATPLEFLLRTGIDFYKTIEGL